MSVAESPAENARNYSSVVAKLSAKKMRLNVHLYFTTFEFESRILKETKTIMESGLVDKVMVMALWKEGLKGEESFGSERSVVRLKPKFRGTRNPLLRLAAYFQLWRSILKRFRREKITLVHAHSLNVLPIAASLKLLRGSKVLYDPHELETECNGLRGTQKALSKITERLFIKFADAVQVVGPEIARWYQDTYRLTNVFVVRNIPIRRDTPTVVDENIFRNKFKIPKADLIFLYQGFFNRGRGIEIIVDAFRDAKPGRHVVFLGYGPLESEVKSAASKHSNIHFHEAVAPPDLPRFTSGADVGLSIIQNTCLSYFYCLPNKVYEYVLAGLPVIVSDFPEMSNVVRELQCGWTVKVDAEELRARIDTIESHEVDRVRARLLQTRAEIGWHTEEGALCRALETALAKS
jgi:glycosyltransferase involved in cell wall biosynthesis